MLRSCLVKKDTLLLDSKLDICEQCILVVVHIRKVQKVIVTICVALRRQHLEHCV